jgi:hypothetical protein
MRRIGKNILLTLGVLSAFGLPITIFLLWPVQSLVVMGFAIFASPILCSGGD